MVTRIILWVLLSGIGIYFISLPDTGPRLITFSKAHGPGMVDSLGILLVILGWLILVLGIWGSRKEILQYKGSKTFSAVLIIIGLAYGMIFASVFSDFTLWWAVGIVILLLVHLWCLSIILRREK